MTRVIAGEHRGRRLLMPPPGSGVRPTSDRVKTILFDILAPCVRDATVLDLFAGTGALGIETLSRGARTATFVERSAVAIELVKANIAALGLVERTDVVRQDGISFARRAAVEGREWTLVVADPPYGRPSVGGLIEAVAVLVAPGGTLALEHQAGDPAPEALSGLTRTRFRPVGRTVLSFYHGIRTEEA